VFILTWLIVGSSIVPEFFPVLLYRSGFYLLLLFAPYIKKMTRKKGVGSREVKNLLVMGGNRGRKEADVLEWCFSNISITNCSNNPTYANDSTSGSSSRESTYMTNDDDFLSDYESCVDDVITKDDEVIEDMICSYILPSSSNGNRILHLPPATLPAPLTIWTAAPLVPLQRPFPIATPTIAPPTLPPPLTAMKPAPPALRKHLTIATPAMAPPTLPPPLTAMKAAPPALRKHLTIATPAMAPPTLPPPLTAMKAAPPALRKVNI
jgi:hypothetical protein